VENSIEIERELLYLFSLRLKDYTTIRMTLLKYLQVLQLIGSIEVFEALQHPY